jgi:hypothetical protein
MTMPTESDFNAAYKINTFLCYAFGALFLGLAIADLFKGTNFFHWMLK